MSDPADEQMALLAGPKKRKSRARVKEPAADLPVARIVVDSPLPHLDRPFDYLVPAHLDADVVRGGRVRVRLAGRLVDGYVLERLPETEHEGRLMFVDRALGESVLSDEVAVLARAVADRYAGTLADVLRLAIPPRHATAESRQAPAPAVGDVPMPAAGSWERYEGGPEFLAALKEGAAPRAVWSALPGSDWPAEIAIAVAAALSSGRSALVVVPDARDVRRVDAALNTLLPPGWHTTLTAELGPAERYRRFLAVRRGDVRAVVGTRGAVFAPLAEPLGLVVVWDDGDETLSEPRAPYPHARDVAVLRAHTTKAAMLVGGLARSAEAQALVATRWARSLSANRATVRRSAPRVVATGDDSDLVRDPVARSARLPTRAWQAAKDALAAGHPVLVQVPRRGYVPALACARCYTRAGCPHCAGPLMLSSGHSVASCRWCGRPAGLWRCPACAHDRLRASVVGAARTAEELGRAFPGTPVKTSGGSAVIDAVADDPTLVVATPGAEPVAEGGYGAVLLLDTWALLTRADLRAGEETLRRWFAAAALARPAADGGQVVVVADAGLHAVQALTRFDPAYAAEHELAERTELGFPPAVRMADLTGPADDIAELLALATLPDSAEKLGPVPAASSRRRHDEVDEPAPERVLVRVPRRDGPALAAALKAAQGARSARRTSGPVRVRLDPLDIV